MTYQLMVLVPPSGRIEAPEARRIVAIWLREFFHTYYPGAHDGRTG